MINYCFPCPHSRLTRSFIATLSTTTSIKEFDKKIYEKGKEINIKLHLNACNRRKKKSRKSVVEWGDIRTIKAEV